MRNFGWVVVVASVVLGRAEEVGADEAAPQRVMRQVTFALTYLNRDLVWLGDPASPTALVYPRPGAEPVAVDAWLTTTTEREPSAVRQYLPARVGALVEGQRKVYAFTPEREKEIGAVDDAGRFRRDGAATEVLARQPEIAQSWPADDGRIAYDAVRNGLYYEVAAPGPVLEESLDFLPWDLSGGERTTPEGRFAIDVAAGDGDRPGTAKVAVDLGEGPIEVARGAIPRVFRRAELELGSYDNRAGTYLPEAAYRPGSKSNPTASVTVEFAGELTAAVDARGARLALVEAPATKPAAPAPPEITIDGRFDDWRNVAGVDDPRGDLVPYLDYVADVDLLEFKVAHDEGHIYLYARVAGKVGRCDPEGGRSYFYAYMDVDQDAGTGFVPSRDDDCYFGVDIGDDCEVQFEFVDNAFRKAFYGFCGLGGDAHVLRQQVTLGKSVYGRFDERGRERAHYKAEYIYRGGKTEITEDLKLGTSDTIRLAVSPDGRQVEIVSDLAGFLKDPQGRPTVAMGQTIDVAAGMECDSKAYIGKSRWGADSTVAIRGYRLGSVESSAPAAGGQ